MNFYLLLLHLAGSVTLLLWAVRMVRTGVERSQEPRCGASAKQGRQDPRRRDRRRYRGGAAVFDLPWALAAGFAGSGILTVATGLALMLGADLGSALVVQILSIDVHWVVPGC